MPIRPLLELRVAHDFFASGIFAEAEITPDAATAAQLRGLRLTSKRTGDALTVFIEIDGGGAPAVAISPSTRLAFTLAPLPAALAAVTAPGPLAPGTVFVDDGAGKPLKPTWPVVRTTETLIKPVGSAPVTLAGRPSTGAAASDFTVVAPAGVAATAFDPVANRVTLNGPAGSVTLTYPVAATAASRLALTIGPDDVAAAAAGRPRTAMVALSATAARWCYHLVTNLPNPLGDWRITRGSGDGPAVAFADADRSEVAAGDAADPFGGYLARRLAPLRVLRFMSSAAVVASETVARRLALTAGTTQLFAALPNPQATQLRRIGGDMAFGEVIRIVTT